MKNEHIELVKRWLADNDSVSLQELEANDEAAQVAASVAYEGATYEGASWESHAAAARAARAAESAAETAAAVAAYWVERYEELTKGEGHA